MANCLRNLALEAAIASTATGIVSALGIPTTGAFQAFTTPVVLFVRTTAVSPTLAEPPASVLQWVTAHWPWARVAGPTDLDQDMVSYLLQTGLTSHPTWAAGDFDGDGRTDFALFVFGKKRSSCSLTLVAVFCPPRGSHRAAVIDHPILPSGTRSPGHCAPDLYVTIVKKGATISRTQAVPKASDEESVTLANDAVKLVYFERSSVVFFWDGERFRRIWTED